MLRYAGVFNEEQMVEQSRFYLFIYARKSLKADECEVPFEGTTNGFVQFLKVGDEWIYTGIRWDR